MARSHRSPARLGTMVGPLAMALALASCGGGGGRREEPSNSSTTPSTSASGGPSGPGTSGPPTTPAPSARPLPPPGSVAFTVTGAPLSEPGLRVLMGAVGGTVRVVVRGVPGGSNGVRICPVTDVTGAPSAEGCVVASDGEAVEIGVASRYGGIVLQPVDASIGGVGRVAEVTLIYVPDTDRITVATPRLDPPEQPGNCPGGRCGMGFELTPTGRGTFVLDAEGRGARPQLTLEAGAPGTRSTGLGRPGSGSSRVVSMVSGGGRLSINSTVDGQSDATLVLENLGESELPVLELSLVWPSVR